MNKTYISQSTVVLAVTTFGSGCFQKRTFVIKTFFFLVGSCWGAGWEGTLGMFHVQALPERS
jgi:hypothetical protein